MIGKEFGRKMNKRLVMRGQHIYSLAEEVHEKMYAYPSPWTPEEKIDLYRSYITLIRKAAYAGYPDAQYDYAQQYENISFLGVQNPLHNPEKCIYWYMKACIQGHGEACNNLAALYEEGRGCLRNLNRAMELYKKAASLGSLTGKKYYRIMQRDMSLGGKYNG